MTDESLIERDWESVVGMLGGAEAIEASAKANKAFLRARAFGSAVDLLRLILAYCLGERGLRSTTGWAASLGIVDISNVALLYRLRRSGDWLAALVGQVLSGYAPAACHGRLIRLVDATSVAKAGRHARTTNRLWRVHGAFDLPADRFGFFDLTDETGGERLDRVPVVEGEIRIGDRAYLQPERIASVLDAGADIVVRAGWKSARWRDGDGAPVDLPAVFGKAAADGLIDRPIFIGRKHGKALGLRMVAVRKPAGAAEAAKRKARQASRRGRHQISEATLAAAK